MTGVELIAAERERQVTQEGWTAEHDLQHRNNELARAAMCYADPRVFVEPTPEGGEKRVPLHGNWPESWAIEWFKPTYRIRDLVKAGALIAAEIDRLQAMEAMK